MYTLRILFYFVFIALANLSLFAQPLMFKKVIQKNEQYYLSNTIIIKLKEKHAFNSSNKLLLADKLQQTLGNFGLVSSKGMFTSGRAEKESGLEKIFVVKYSSDIDPQILASKINKFSDVEWVEPKYVYPVEYIPNDPFYSTQYALQKIKAADAWNVSTGDTSIVIAIIDTGVDWDHPDLAANIWQNWDEIPGNGIDDDGNDFVDDIRGWDFGGLNGIPDNDPMEDRPDHGTHVAGDASAVTDNSIGISSIGFRSKIMPVKTIRDDLRSPSGSPFVVYGYEGIVYAVDNGAQVINCSWGGGGYSLLGQEVINYAAANGSLVVAAAGNNNSADPFYPASFKNVLSVAATDEGDMKTYFSNYGAGVDVSAPGINIYSTWQNDTYRFGLGTSFASPIAAGLAALVKVRFPFYNANQIAEQIRTNCDDINSINPDYTNQLGRGRINALKSLSNTNSKSVRAIDVKFSDEAPGGNGDGILQAGETVLVKCKFVNFLASTTNLGIYLESSNLYSTVQNGIFIAGSKATLDTFTNTASVFSFTISPGVPHNSLLTFNINYLDGSYLDFQVASVAANPTYATQSGNNISFTITSKGTFAFNDYMSNSQGDGFKYLSGPNHLFEGALMLAVSSSQVSDGARGNSPSVQNTDFTTIQPFVLNSPGQFADVEGSCIVNDNAAGSNKIGITAKLNSFSFGSAADENNIILRYKLTNNNLIEINNLYAGLFFDWDITDGYDDFTAYDSIGNFGYCYHVGGNPTTWVASALVSSGNYGFWAINNQGGDGGFRIDDGFGDSEKWQSLSSGIGKLQAGAGDVSHVISGGPFSIQPNETITVGFVIAAGFNLNDLRSSVANARIKYAQIPTSILINDVNKPTAFYLSQNYPNPFNPTTKIRYAIPSGSKGQASRAILKVYNMLGNEIGVLVNQHLQPGNYDVKYSPENTLPSGVYFYRLQVGDLVETKKMLLLR